MTEGKKGFTAPGSVAGVSAATAEELANALREMKELFRFALLCTTPELAREGMAYIRNAEALLARTGAQS